MAYKMYFMAVVEFIAWHYFSDVAVKSVKFCLPLLFYSDSVLTSVVFILVGYDCNLSANMK